jgi:hypothetical protein
MNILVIYLAGLIASAAGLEPKGAQPQPRPPAPPAPPPVAKAPAQLAAQEKYVYDQKPVGGGRSYLVTPEQAQTIVNRFKEVYPKLGSPRILIYVNRELIDENSGMKLSARKVEIKSARGETQLNKGAQSGASANSKAATAASPNESSSAPKAADQVTAENTYRFRDPKAASLADRQTVRDIERLLGRPLRLAGAVLVDQQVAAQVLAAKPLESFHTSTESEQAAREREALSKIADVVLEVLMSSRNVTISEISGDKVYSVPDLQVTAIRLKDARIIGQATASDIIGGAGSKATRAYDVREITEATALSLMEEIALTQ